MPVLVKTEVGGIQKFIFATGKMKEMIGGSEIVRYVCDKEFYQPLLTAINCARAVEKETEGTGWHMVLHNNAGTLTLMLPDEEAGFNFLQACSRKVLENFPGLPYFGAQVPVEWNNQALEEAYKDIEKRITAQRNSGIITAGIPMLPVLRASRLDGLPAVAMEGEDNELLSLPSLCKRNPKILKMSASRLRKDVPLPENVKWSNDPEAILGNSSKMALIHIDGNDMGKLFSHARQQAANLPLVESIATMQALSTTIEAINTQAFSFAAKEILNYIIQYDKSAIQNDRIIMPMRPMVMGGDDITLIIRADLALFFIHLFLNSYEKLALNRELPLSVGVGMVVMDSSWPFAKAFALVEDLTKNAKKITRGSAPRPSSMDYLVITEEVDQTVAELRRRVYTAQDGSILTSKPFLLSRGFLPAFMEEGKEVLETLPRSALRPAFASCRRGANRAGEFWLNMRENLERRLGGRKGKLMRVHRFEYLFPENNFFQTSNGQRITRLGDFLELARLLPGNDIAINNMLRIMRAGGEQNA